MISALIAGFWAFFRLFRMDKEMKKDLGMMDIEENISSEFEKLRSEMNDLKLSNLILVKKVEHMSEQLKAYEEKN